MNPPEEKRPRGRPKLTEPRSTVSVWLPAKAHDRLIQLAKQQEQSISATVRELLRLRLR
jgi:hypothetical protein